MRQDPGLIAMLDSIVGSLADQNWAVMPNFLPATIVSELVSEIRTHASAGIMRPAGVGRGADFQVRAEIRSDMIHWLDLAALTPPEQVAWDQLAALRTALNRQLFLGLRELESHLTLYPPGAAYARHVDNFRNASRRRVSAIIYLNSDWQPSDGGILRLYDSAESRVIAEVEPRAGTLACFLSADVPHEVLPATKERMSLTGWFLDR
jgi:SM-20-related protein